MLVLVHITPNQTPCYGVFAQPSGEPEFRPIVCWGCMESTEANHRVVAGIALGKHPEPADVQPEFVGYAYDTDPAPWRERCAAQREVIREAAEEAGKKKIIVPGEKKIVGYPGNN